MDRRTPIARHESIFGADGPPEREPGRKRARGGRGGAVSRSGRAEEGASRAPGLDAAGAGMATGPHADTMRRHWELRRARMPPRCTGARAPLEPGEEPGERV